MWDPRDLASAMKRLRGDRPASKLAARAGIDPSTWSAYEGGKQFPRTQERLEQIAHALGCTYSRLEEAMWESRNLRLASEEAIAKSSPLVAAEAAAEARTAAAGDPALTFIRERLTNISRELEELFLYVAEEKRSRS
jgi:transcriptional regulator with XRE-family HTH domain